MNSEKNHQKIKYKIDQKLLQIIIIITNKKIKLNNKKINNKRKNNNQINNQMILIK